DDLVPFAGAAGLARGLGGQEVAEEGVAGEGVAEGDPAVAILEVSGVGVVGVGGDPFGAIGRRRAEPAARLGLKVGAGAGVGVGLEGGAGGGEGVAEAVIDVLGEGLADAEAVLGEDRVGVEGLAEDLGGEAQQGVAPGLGVAA